MTDPDLTLYAPMGCFMTDAMHDPCFISLYYIPCTSRHSTLANCFPLSHPLSGSDLASLSPVPDALIIWLALLYRLYRTMCFYPQSFVRTQQTRLVFQRSGE